MLYSTCIYVLYYICVVCGTSDLTYLLIVINCCCCRVIVFDFSHQRFNLTLCVGPPELLDSTKSMNLQ
jgi:hypothetical protein